jgi:hypothetical protein
LEGDLNERRMSTRARNSCLSNRLLSLSLTYMHTCIHAYITPLETYYAAFYSKENKPKNVKENPTIIPENGQDAVTQKHYKGEEEEARPGKHLRGGGSDRTSRGRPRSTPAPALLLCLSHLPLLSRHESCSPISSAARARERHIHTKKEEINTHAPTRTHYAGICIYVRMFVYIYVCLSLLPMPEQLRREPRVGRGEPISTTSLATTANAHVSKTSVVWGWGSGGGSYFYDNGHSGRKPRTRIQ